MSHRGKTLADFWPVPNGNNSDIKIVQCANGHEAKYITSAPLQVLIVTNNQPKPHSVLDTYIKKVITHKGQEVLCYNRDKISGKELLS